MLFRFFLRSTCYLSLASIVAASPPVPLPTSTSAPRLRDGVVADIRRHKFPLKNVGIAVIDDRGKTIVGLNAERPYKPASSQKLLTTAAALHYLGLDYAFETLLVAEASPENGVIDGDVVLRGGGDPNISGRFYGDKPTALLHTWARQLREAGVERITGDLIADDTLFDDVRFLPGWKRTQEGRWFCAQISALSLNDNCVDFTVTPARSVGAAARVRATPQCDAVKISGAPKTVAGSKSRVLLHRVSGTNRIRVSGTIGLRAAPYKDHVTVDDPAVFFASTLARVFKDEGISVQGTVRKARDSDTPVNEEGGFTLVRHTSKLSADLPVIHKRSQNLHAELLLKTLGARIGGEGSVDGGAVAIRKYLREVGLPATDLVIADGSGLAHDNRATPALFARLLHSLRRHEQFSVYRDSLAIATKDGTLAKRFRDSPLSGRLYGKTGSILGVSTLTGYITKGDRVWSFAILINGYPPGSIDARGLQERICERLYRAMSGS